VGLAVGLWPRSQALADEPFFTGIGDLPGGSFSSDAINVSGNGSLVVGQSASDLSYKEPFRWQRGVMTGLGLLEGAVFGTAEDASYDGSVIVGLNHFGPTREAYRWTAETGVVGLGDLYGQVIYSDAYGVSADGSVAVGRGTNSSFDHEAFRWTEETGMVGLGDLPGGSFDSGAFAVSGDGGVVVGWSQSEQGREAFRWADGVMTGLGFFPGGSYWSMATDVSANGLVVVGNGKSAASGSDTEAFRWTEETGMVGLGDLPGGEFESEARAVSADGAVVVGRSDMRYYTDIWEAFIWDEVNAMRRLHDVLTDLGLDLMGWRLQEAWGVSDDGLTIVGEGRNPLGRSEGWIAQIPEPATISLLILGLPALCRQCRN